MQIIDRLRKIPVSPLEHAPALPQGSMAPRRSSDTGAHRAAVTGAPRQRVPLTAGAAAARTAPAGAPPMVATATEGVSPFAAAADAAAAAADAAAAAPHTTSNTSDSLAAKASGPILAPAGSLPTPFKTAQQQGQQGSEMGTQLSSCVDTDLGSSGDPGSVEMSRAASATVQMSRKGSAAAGRGSRQPSVPAPGLPRPPHSPFSAATARSSSLSPGREASSQQQGGKEGAG